MKTSRHKMKTMAILGMITAFCLSVGVLAVKAATEVVLADVTGQVEVRSQQVTTWKTAGNGAVLHHGDVIRTGPKSRAEVHFQGGTIRMYENTILELPSKPKQLKMSEDSTRLETVLLQKGRSLFQVFKKRLNGGFEVTTPSLIAGVKGTTFRVTEEEGLKGVTVFEGIVQVTNREHPEERIDVTSQHFTIISEGHLTPPRAFQGKDPESSEEERRLQTRFEERLTDLLEENRDLEVEVLSNSIRLDTSSTTHTLSSTTDSITGTLTGTVTDAQEALNTTTGTVTGTVTDLTGTSLLALP